MPNLFVIFYRDLVTEKTGTEYIQAQSIDAALEVFKITCPSKYPYIIRTTEYQKIQVINA